jgi:cell shape-determining protein MreD
MKIYVIFSLLGLALISVQSHPFFPFSYDGVRLDLVLPLVVYMGTLAGIDLCAGALVVAITGYMVSVFSGSPVGLYSLIYLIIFLLVRFLKSFFVLQKLSLLVAVVAIGCVFEGSLIVSLLYVFYKSSITPVLFRNILLWQMFYTSLLAVLVLLVLQYVYTITLRGAWTAVFRQQVLPNNGLNGKK